MLEIPDIKYLKVGDIAYPYPTNLKVKELINTLKFMEYLDEELILLTSFYLQDQDSANDMRNYILYNLAAAIGGFIKEIRE